MGVGRLAGAGCGEGGAKGVSGGNLDRFLLKMIQYSVFHNPNSF